MGNFLNLGLIGYCMIPQKILFKMLKTFQPKRKEKKENII